ncbi:hypothetical protein [Mesorhizobium sp. WSM3859]|uniref:hypothetical protein n=1 Tax=Mesorhizobium sp. WSM3859 TaxID=2029402 RepID=UPI001596B4AB|nr:hypothetical protein [Mesorhizobium sp. WSM3859]
MMKKILAASLLTIALAASGAMAQSVGGGATAGVAYPAVPPPALAVYRAAQQAAFRVA